jgi:Tfp pilus assembly protein PilE
MAKNSKPEKTDVLGIISIVMAFISLQIPGLIIGLVGEKQAKKEGRSPRLSRIGWILNLVILVVAVVVIAKFFAVIPAHRNSVDDAGRQADLRYFSNKLEEYHQTMGYYPASIEQFAIRTIDTKDDDGKSYAYIPKPDGCTECKSYTLRTTLEKADNGSNTYEVLSKHQ